MGLAPTKRKDPMSVTFFVAAADSHLPNPEGFEALEINMSNANARFVLDALGCESQIDLCGEEDAEAFLGRVLMALAVAPSDEGVPAHVLDDEHLNFIECGRHEGYLQDRLQELHILAQTAADAHAYVAWA
jgi:hypothetical protein